jgi:predicted TPR repeat methyltransferase
LAHEGEYEKLSMSDSWDEYASDWDANKDAKLYAESAYETLRNTVSLNRLNILDFGCGTGLLTEKLSPIANKIIALDSSQKMIDVLNQKNLINVSTLSTFLSKESIEANQILHEKFDLIVASSVCSFLENYETTLVLLKTLLTKNGTFVQWDWLAKEEGVGPGLTTNRVQSALQSAGFNTINITQPFVLDSSKGSMAVLMASAKNA